MTDSKSLREKLELTRFGLAGEYDLIMAEMSDGEWVRYTDAIDLLALVQQHESDLAAAQAELAKAQETIQQQARELEEADEALIVATEVAQDMRGYCRGWDWKYGAEWDAALTASEQRMAAALARQEQRRKERE